MRNLLALVGLVVVIFAGLGNYLGWYRFNWSPGKDGKQHINVEVDTKKIGRDGQTGLDKLGEFTKEKLQKETDAEFVGPPEPKTKSLVNTPAPR